MWKFYMTADSGIKGTADTANVNYIFIFSKHIIKLMFPLPDMLFFTQTGAGFVIFYVSTAGYNKFIQKNKTSYQKLH